MNNPHALPASTRDEIITAAIAFANELWPAPDTITLHGSKFPHEWGTWGLGEVRSYTGDGRMFRAMEEHLYGEGGNEELADAFETVGKAVSDDVHAAAWTFAEDEPWLAVVDITSVPRLVWRITTATPISYDHYRELPAD